MWVGKCVECSEIQEVTRHHFSEVDVCEFCLVVDSIKEWPEDDAVHFVEQNNFSDLHVSWLFHVLSKLEIGVSGSGTIYKTNVELYDRISWCKLFKEK
jgi:hypothetical protein